MTKYIRKVHTQTVTYEVVELFGKSLPAEVVEREKQRGEVHGTIDEKPIVTELEPWRPMTEVELHLLTYRG